MNLLACWRGAVRAAGVAILTIILAGCPGRHYPKPEIAGRLLSASERDVVLSELATQQEQVRSLKLLARLSIVEDGQSFAGRMAVVYARPQLLRIELFPLTSFTALSSLIANDGRFVLRSRDQEGDYEGDERLLARMIGVQLDPERFASILGAYVSVVSDFEEYKIYQPEGSSDLHIVLRDFEGYWVLDRTSKVLRHAEFRDPFHDKLRARVDYGAVRAFPGGAGPSEITLDAPEEDRQFKLVLTSFVLNAAVREDLFNLEGR